MKCKRWLTRVVLAALLALPFAVHGQNLTVDPPGPKAFVQDLARMVEPDDVMAIRQIGERLLAENGIPIIVVTIESMANHGGAGWRIETFARVLFDQWGIGYETIEGQPWNRGVLLLVSRDDRKARIELGNDWAGQYDAVCRKIMDNQIIPNFKKGQFSAGILAGVRDLDAMCRSIPVPSGMIGGQAQPGTASGAPGAALPQEYKDLGAAPGNMNLAPPVRPDWFWPAVGVTVFLAIFTAISMIRSGASGWAWAFWAVVFGVIGFILYAVATSSRSSRGFGGGGGGFSGGSFGGGFGGGGGATGSW